MVLAAPGGASGNRKSRGVSAPAHNAMPLRAWRLCSADVQQQRQLPSRAVRRVFVMSCDRLTRRREITAAAPPLVAASAGCRCVSEWVVLFDSGEGPARSTIARLRWHASGRLDTRLPAMCPLCEARQQGTKEVLTRSAAGTAPHNSPEGPQQTEVAHT